MKKFSNIFHRLLNTILNVNTIRVQSLTHKTTYTHIYVTLNIPLVQQRINSDTIKEFFIKRVLLSPLAKSDTKMLHNI